MQNSTNYFNDYNFYESKSCFFKQDVEEEQKKTEEPENPFFTGESFKPEEPEQVVKSFEELIFLYSTPTTYEPYRYRREEIKIIGKNEKKLQRPVQPQTVPVFYRREQDWSTTSWSSARTPVFIPTRGIKELVIEKY